MAGYTKKIPLPGKTAEVIYAAVSKDIERFLDKTPVGKFEVSRNESQKEVKFTSSMASGSLAAKENEIQIDISLSFLASPFKGKLDEGIQKWLAKTFG